MEIEIIDEIYENTKKYRIRLGLCCINTILRHSKPEIFCSRNLIRRTYTIEKAKNLALRNIKDLIKMIEWNQNEGITLFRISSDIFPRFTDVDVSGYTIDFARPLLKEVGDLIKKYNHRILMHPGQYNQVGAKDSYVFEKTVFELEHHCDILDAMGMGKESVIIVHGGGTYGDKLKTIERWIEQFNLLPEKVKYRLVLENCERGYSPSDCLDICKRINIPMVFDCHHYECYIKLHPKEIVNLDIPGIISTWNGITPIMHVSNQGQGRIGNHSDYIDIIPDYILDIPEKYGINIDLEVEAKMKEQAIFKLREKYRDNRVKIY